LIFLKNTRRRKLNKTDLINEMAGVLKSKNDAKAALDRLLEAITNALKNGDSITLTGFGTFKAVERKARTVKNIQTGKEITVNARKAPKFIPGKVLKDAVK
jgi:nucleoid DNA-binding protein